MYFTMILMAACWFHLIRQWENIWDRWWPNQNLQFAIKYLIDYVCLQKFMVIYIKNSLAFVKNNLVK